MDYELTWSDGHRVGCAFFATYADMVSAYQTRVTDFLWGKPGAGRLMQISMLKHVTSAPGEDVVAVLAVSRFPTEPF